MEETKPCIHAEVCADGCDLEDMPECGYYQAERTCQYKECWRSEEGEETHYKCSLCGIVYGMTAPTFKFCPRCGARVERDA